LKKKKKKKFITIHKLSVKGTIEQYLITKYKINNTLMLNLNWLANRNGNNYLISLKNTKTTCINKWNAMK